MNKIIPLNNDKHKLLKVTSSSDFRRFKDQHLIPVIAQDFSSLATEFPIVFVKNVETGQFIAVAMMGIRNGINLYCQDEHWSAPVFPLGFTNAPLSLVKRNENSDEVVVCIDESSNLVSEETGKALFNDQGEKTSYLKQRAQTLLNIAENNVQTQTIVKLFADKNLLVRRQLNVNLAAEKEPFTIDGIYTIDEQILNELNNEDFEQLRTKGLLPLVYAHLNSLHQIARLTMKQNELDKEIE
jgi:hypothetical protein